MTEQVLAEEGEGHKASALQINKQTALKFSNVFFLRRLKLITLEIKKISSYHVIRRKFDRN